MLKEIVLGFILADGSQRQSEQKRAVVAVLRNVFVVPQLGYVHMIRLVRNLKRGLPAKRIEPTIPVHRDPVFGIQMQI